MYVRRARNLNQLLHPLPQFVGAGRLVQLDVVERNDLAIRNRAVGALRGNLACAEPFRLCGRAGFQAASPWNILMSRVSYGNRRCASVCLKQNE